MAAASSPVLNSAPHTRITRNDDFSRPPQNPTFRIMDIVQAIRWSDDGTALRIIDQRELPAREVTRELRTLEDVCEAIRSLAVRGAPAIGIAAAMGLVVSVQDLSHLPRDSFLEHLRSAATSIRSTRPTAVNLGWALDRMLAVAGTAEGEPTVVIDRLRAESSRILEDDRAMCRRIGQHGAALIPDGARVLTHCNTGALATGGIGTALAAVYVAVEQGKRLDVYAAETRPLLQGSRLTAWELSRAGIPVTVLVDGAAAWLIRERKIDLCMVGADRIATNGDVANKVGTYSLAIAARHHDVPFYVAAPNSTFDPHAASGAAIEIEQRGAEELSSAFGVQTSPSGVAVYNPAFDVTPAELITGIISDAGVHRAPYDFGRHT
jgi:methylthioribose-1-phosphate isomerase